MFVLLSCVIMLLMFFVHIMYILHFMCVVYLMYIMYSSYIMYYIMSIMYVAQGVGQRGTDFPYFLVPINQWRNDTLSPKTRHF